MGDARIGGLVEEALKHRYSRRQILRRATILGLSASAVNVVLAACGGGDEGGGGGSTGNQATQPTDETPEQGSSATEAPNVLKGTKLNVLQATYFVPAGEELFQQQLGEWGKENNVEVTVDYVNWPDLQPKIGAGIQAQSGPDIVQLWDTWPYLYYQNMVDVHDLATKIGDEQGGFYDWVINTASVDGHWYSVPDGNSTAAFAYRMSYFKEAGVPDKESMPKTWDELFEVGKRLKEMGKPLGQALGHSLGDPPGYTYAYMWTHGAMEVEEDGETVAFNTEQFVEGMRKFIQGWKDCYDETGLSWDDSTNNRAFLGDQISGTFNGSSIYIKAREEHPDIAEDTDHVNYFTGPAGQFNLLGSRSHGIMKYSENVEGAKAFLEWWYTPERFRKWLEVQQGYVAPATPFYKDESFYTEDPKLAAYLEVVNFARNKGYAGPANQKAALAYSKYIVIDTFAKAIQDNDPEGAIKWGASELEKIYSR